MNRRINRIILLFAAIGFCALIYSAWHYYQEQQAAEAAREYFNQPYSGDTFNPKNNAPPVKTH
jgi:lipopolysaccharide export system protein LptC